MSLTISPWPSQWLKVADDEIRVFVEETRLYGQWAGSIGVSKCTCNLSHRCVPALPDSDQSNMLSKYFFSLAQQPPNMAEIMKNQLLHNMRKQFKKTRRLCWYQMWPFWHAFPDFLCKCDCCGQGCGQVKCPYCIDGIDFDVLFPKRERVFHRGIQTPWNEWRHEAVGRVLLLFRGVWIHRWNTKHEFWK